MNNEVVDMTEFRRQSRGRRHSKGKLLIIENSITGLWATIWKLK